MIPIHFVMAEIIQAPPHFRTHVCHRNIDWPMAVVLWGNLHAYSWHSYSHAGLVRAESEGYLWSMHLQATCSRCIDDPIMLE